MCSVEACLKIPNTEAYTNKHTHTYTYTYIYTNTIHAHKHIFNLQALQHKDAELEQVDDSLLVFLCVKAGQGLLVLDICHVKINISCELANF